MRLNTVLVTELWTDVDGVEVRGGPAHKHQCAEGEESQSFLFHKANLHDLYEVLSQCGGLGAVKTC